MSYGPRPLDELLDGFVAYFLAGAPCGASFAGFLVWDRFGRRASAN